MHFSPTLRYFRKNNARNMNYMAALIFQKNLDLRKKCLFPDKLLVVTRHTGARHIVMRDVNPCRPELAEKAGASMAVQVG